MSTVHTQRERHCSWRTFVEDICIYVCANERARVFVYLPVYRLQSTRLSTEKKKNRFLPRCNKRKENTYDTTTVHRLELTSLTKDPEEIRLFLHTQNNEMREQKH